MDYKQLLIKYIEYVKSCGSCNFILKLDQPYIKFTKEEVEELNDLIKSLDDNKREKTKEKIEELYLSVRALNSIRKAGIKTTEELFSLDEEQMRLLNFGKKTINEILNYERTNTTTDRQL